MAKKSPENQALERIRRASQDEALAVELIEDMRWGGEPACPRCGDLDVYAMKDRKSGERERNYRWRCRGCAKMFSVRTGTVFEETRLPLRHWCHAFWRACASKKGVSALQISRECQITHKSALFLMHRIRKAMEAGPDAPKLSGTVEADETFIGGRQRYSVSYRDPYRHEKLKAIQKPKTPVFAVVERGGQVRAGVVTSVTRDNLRAEIDRWVDKNNARLMTDELPAYITVGKEFAHGHESVAHGFKEYARGDVTTNTVEGFFSILKRGINGTFHSVSRHHLPRYVSEFAFRYNTRDVDDAERTAEAIRGAEGKRLLYRQPS